MEPIIVTEPRPLTKLGRLVPRDGPFEADIVLYAADTQNSWKVAMLLEELGVQYDVVPINIGKNEQKEPWFMEMNPNGRTPAMLDRSKPDEPFFLFESGAMLLYICDKFGSPLLPKDARGRSEVEQWVMWQVSALGPMLGNCMYFKRIAAPWSEDISKLQFGIDRYHRESERLLQVLESRLCKREYLCGPGAGEFTAADIACYGYAQSHWWAGLDVSGLPGLTAWLARVAERPATAAGMTVPRGKINFMADPSDSSAPLRKRLKENASAAGRPHFGWRDVSETSSQGVAVDGALKPPEPKAFTAPEPVKCLLLTYSYVEDYLEKRTPHRAAHLAHARSYVERGVLLMAGPLDPPQAAHFIFKGLTQTEVEAFAVADPYVTNGVVVSHKTIEWNVMVGSAM